MIMIRVNIHEIKAKLSHFIEMVEAGESVVVCRRNVPVAELRPLGREPDARRPQLGSAAGQGRILPGFDEPLTEDELVLWEGGSSAEPGER
jgi:prevent-host-death family protein